MVREGEVRMHHLVDHSDYGVKWNLYLIKRKQGKNRRHYFFKYFLLPSGTPNFGKAKCQERGWEYLGSINTTSQHSWDEIFGHIDFPDEEDFNHHHIGIMMPWLGTEGCRDCVF